MENLKSRATRLVSRSYSSCSSGACTSSASYADSSSFNSNSAHYENHRTTAPYLKHCSSTSYDNVGSDDNEDYNVETYGDRPPFDLELGEVEVENDDDYVDMLDNDQNEGTLANDGAAIFKLIDKNFRALKIAKTLDEVKAYDDCVESGATVDCDIRSMHEKFNEENNADDHNGRSDDGAEGNAAVALSFNSDQSEGSTFNFTLPLETRRTRNDVEYDDDRVVDFPEKSQIDGRFHCQFEVEASCDVCGGKRLLKRQTRHGDLHQFDTNFEMTLPLKVEPPVLRCDEPQPVRLTFKRRPEQDVDRYYKICTLGVGTFGRVSLVRLKSTRQYYALKTMSIKSVVQYSQVDHVHAERCILESVDHPFVVKLHWAYKDDRFLYMLLDYMPGGELFSYIRVKKRFRDETARFYATEILLALEYLHTKKIVYRDLKPENLLLDSRGHVILVDFGFGKILNGRTWTMCGTAEYLAPEIILGTGHNKAVDYWAFGVLIYEMLAGRPPFRDETSFLTYQKILSGKLKFPQRFCSLAKDLVRQLLVVDRTKRLGNGRGNVQEIRNHKWFTGINWSDIYNRSVQPPIVPRVHCEGDSGNFDEYDENNDFLRNTEQADPWELEQFKNW